MRLTRLAIKKFVARYFNTSSFHTSLATDDGGQTYHLALDLDDLVAHRHADQNPTSQNADPEVLQELLAALRRSDHAPAVASSSCARPAPHTRSDNRRRGSSGRASYGPPPNKRPRIEEQDSIPQLSYRLRSATLPPVPKDKPNRNQRRKRNHVRRMVEEADTFQAEELQTEALPASTTWWMGTKFPSYSAEQLRAAHATPQGIGRHLSGINLVPYLGQATRFLDAQGRLLIYRSKITDDIRARLGDFAQEAKAFVKACTPMAEGDMAANSRGRHWFCIAGVDRNNKSAPAFSKWHKDNEEHIKHFFRPGTAFSFFNGLASSMAEAHFPGIAGRYKACRDYMRTKYNIPAQFGLFFNWCLNAPRPSVKRVHCDPHVDFKNIALGICVIFVYGVFNFREKAWLVIWEAGICLELPPGVFLLYPSALFFHFNVDRIQIVTTANGERPTRENSSPLCPPEDVSEEDWEAGNGRGSVVWFNQASMFQTSETGHETLEIARRKGHSGNADGDKFLGEDGVFPKY
ncbi:hypothetical protein BDZ89DRAFT_1127585 [Hymenopellis radicata]|nr:hypothetical protein BDZ89DRAFT_1127585 [Hymenopellis radicata]